MSRSSVASIALVAAAAFAGAVVWLSRMDKRRRPVEEVNRWESEGGNVPDVAVEGGKQGSGRTGRPAISRRSEDQAGASAKANEPWPFPRS